jgi:hypothetical protein
MFSALCVFAVLVAVIFCRTSVRNPQLQLDEPNK